MKRIKLTVAYDGTAYCGWQLQNNGITVEGVLNRQLSRITGEQIKVIGASRTDAGVHARGNVAVFDTDSPIPADRIAFAVNSGMPEDIVVVRSEEVLPDWHPRHCDSVKTYEYSIYNNTVPDPLARHTSWFVSYPLSLDAMRSAAEYIRGRHDFKSFCNIHTHVEDTVRTIYDLDVDRNGNMVTIKMRGNGFLYNMVRIIAGTLVQVGRGFIPADRVEKIIEAKNRETAGPTAPPQGLVLVGIDYPGSEVL